MQHSSHPTFPTSANSPILKIATGVWPPSTNPCSLYTLADSLQCPYPGMDAELLGVLLTNTNISYQLIPFPPNAKQPVDWGSVNQEGNTTGLFSLLQNGTVDTISAVYAMQPGRVEHFDFSYPVEWGHLSFVVQKTGNSFMDSASLVFRVFKIDLWLVILLTLFVLLIFATVQSRILSSLSSPGQKRLGLFCFLAFFLQHAYQDMRSKFSSANLTLHLIGMLSIIALNLYQGTLLGQIMTSSYQKPIQDLLPLLESGQYRLVTDYLNDPFLLAVASGNTTAAMRYRKVLAKYPPIFYDDHDDLPKALLAPPGNKAYATFAGKEAKMLVNNHCRLSLLHDQSFEAITLYGFIFRKGSPWPNLLRKTIISLLPMRDYFAHHASPNASRTCQTTHNFGTLSLRTLGLYSLLGAFFFLISGAIAGIIGVLLENILSLISAVFWRLPFPYL